MSSIAESISTVTDKDLLIESLQSQVDSFKRQIEEFQDLRLLIVKVTGKNTVRKLKTQCLTASDRINATEISHWFRECLWPHVKLLPHSWHKWSEHPKSICQRVLSVIGVPNGFTHEEYWSSIALSIANEKLCAMRSNTKQAMFSQFKGITCGCFVPVTLTYQLTNTLLFCMCFVKQWMSKKQRECLASSIMRMESCY
jgi:hypothetical protein